MKLTYKDAAGQQFSREVTKLADPFRGPTGELVSHYRTEDAGETLWVKIVGGVVYVSTERDPNEQAVGPVIEIK